MGCCCCGRKLGPSSLTSMALCGGSTSLPTTPTLYNVYFNYAVPPALVALALPAYSCHRAFALTWNCLSPKFHNAFFPPRLYSGLSLKSPPQRSLAWPYHVQTLFGLILYLPPTCFRSPPPRLSHPPCLSHPPLVSPIPTCNK